ncbi:MarR family winged helix-turn-helix transcriptional regulator (plasmid) [Agrobacterium fabrum]|uniref:MarR family winged helix-turn-helix transcriptional regulator n=1 Tax=Agrobacterium fabrum TaxID=1176649 RepID=UPI00157348C6|nr:MarR family winged helix-turn-helix transcriptional regulator [Agrobacterium fabrum]NTB10477.1 winged helix-turn-helix transcriptional regulator [Agrobacterium fabrum]
MRANPEEDLCFAVVRFARLLSRQMNLSLRELALTGEQIALLDAVERIPLPRNKDVSLALGLDPSTVSANIKPLLRLGLIMTLDKSSDHREKHLELTADGRRKLLSARAILVETDANIKRKLEERGSLRSVTLALDRLC